MYILWTDEIKILIKLRLDKFSVLGKKRILMVKDNHQCKENLLAKVQLHIMTCSFL